MDNSNIKIKSDPFWTNDFSILYRQNRLGEFFPSNKYSKVENLNSLVRLSFYCSIVLAIHRKNINYLIVTLLVAALTVFIHRFSSVVKKEIKEEMTNLGTCTMPSKNNPFMNTLLTDIGVYKERPPACEGEDVDQKVDDQFYDGLYQDVNDIYQRQNSQRQFFTMPETTELGVKNGESVKFANWLFNNLHPTCKEDTMFCVEDNYYYDDLRNKAVHP